MPPRSALLQGETSVVEGRTPTLDFSKKTSFASATTKIGRNGNAVPLNRRRRIVPGGDRRKIKPGMKRRPPDTTTSMSTSPIGVTSSNNLNGSYDYSVPDTAAEEDENQQHLPEENVAQGADANNTAGVYPYNSNTAMNPYGSGYYGSSAGMMMMPPMYMGGGMGAGPFSGIYQVLYGVQNVVFSITQAVQLVGMNQQLLQQAWESLSQMVDHAIATFYEMRALEQNMSRQETEEDKQRRKRLKALRYALVLGGSWLAYKIVKGLLFQKKNRRRLGGVAAASNGNSGVVSSLFGSSAMSPYSSSYYGGGMGYTSPYTSMNNGMFNGGTGYPGSAYF